ncbi:MAG: HAD family hydrolase [Lachnospiraceae bacterium]|nr:HAD family hydrolase [Lachnospiraceae bacterium]
MTKAVIFDMYETLITHYQSPLYFGAQMAADIGIPEQRFRELWRPTEDDRSTGKMTLEEVVEMILRKTDRYSEELFHKLIEKRIAAKLECFNHVHPEIFPLLEKLKEKGLRIGLISNCFSEEAKVIRECALFPYFEAAYLSYEQGVQKPDAEIFFRCMKELDVRPEECLYVGDGGSRELEAASGLGMKAVQAAWYLQEGTTQQSGRKPEFCQLESPLEVLAYLEKDG